MSYEGNHLCYAELNQRANRLAARLRAMGARPGTFVCLLVERSLEAITGLLARSNISPSTLENRLGPIHTFAAR